MIYVNDNELVGIYVDNLPGRLSVITSNDKRSARFSPLTGNGLVSYSTLIDELKFSGMGIQLSKRTRQEADFLRRFSCGFCDGSLSAPECGARFDKCSLDIRIVRLGTALKEFNSRRAQNVRN